MTANIIPECTYITGVCEQHRGSALVIVEPTTLILQFTETIQSCTNCHPVFQRGVLQPPPTAEIPTVEVTQVFTCDECQTRIGYREPDDNHLCAKCNRCKVCNVALGVDTTSKCNMCQYYQSLHDANEPHAFLTKCSICPQQNTSTDAAPEPVKKRRGWFF